MFGRKKGETAKPEAKPGNDADTYDLSQPPLKPFSKKGSHAPAKPPASIQFRPEVPRRVVPDIPGTPSRRIDRGPSGDADSKRLVIGRDICLSGEVTSCDKLVVEGRVEVVLPNAQVIEVAPSGYFKGSADVQEADISGRFEGELVARDRLIVRAGGRISGAIRYGRIVIESGGEISGDMQTLDSAEPADVPSPEKEPENAREDDPEEAPKRKRGGSKSAAGKK